MGVYLYLQCFAAGLHSGVAISTITVSFRLVCLCDGLVTCLGCTLRFA